MRTKNKKRLSLLFSILTVISSLSQANIMVILLFILSITMTLLLLRNSYILFFFFFYINNLLHGARWQTVVATFVTTYKRRTLA